MPDQTTQPTPEERGYTEQTWTYIGRRTGRTTSLVSCWIDHAGEQRTFKKFDGRVIGGHYLIWTKPDGGSIGVLGQPRYQGKGDDPRIPQWELDDRASVTARDLQARERRDARDGQMGAMTLDEVREKMAGSFGAPRTALLAHVLRHIGA